MARAQQPTTSSRRSESGNVAPPIAASAAPRASEVAARAYELWVRGGCVHGKDQEYWFEAERQLLARQAAR